MFKNYRIIEQQNINGDIVFVPQERKLIFFWVPFMEMNMFPRKIEFETLGNAEKFIKTQFNKPKERIHYY